jgi:hypothetical protein
MQIPLAVLISVLVASLAPWIFLLIPVMWLVWQVVREPAPASASVLQHDGNA